MTSTVDQFVTAMLPAYMECALWSSVDEDGDPLDDVHTFDDLAPETVADMESDLAGFLALVREAGIDWQSVMSPDQFAHDLWLTRNGHGAGFWDRGLGDIGDQLSDLARSFGSSDLYIGDDGMIYAA